MRARMQWTSTCHDPEVARRRTIELTHQLVEAGLVETQLGKEAHDFSLDLYTPTQHQAHALRRACGDSIVRLIAHGVHLRQDLSTMQCSGYLVRSQRR